jgi:hypothetical protein
MSVSSPAISYEDLVASYSNNLEVQTRGFSAGLSWLESWVPDDDLLCSLINLVEAAQIGGMDALSLRIKSPTLGDLSPSDLPDLLSHMASINLRIEEDEVVLEVADLAKSAFFSDVRDFYKAALRNRFDKLKFNKSAPSGAFLYEDADAALWIALDHKTNIVTGAGCMVTPSASRSMAATMDLLCELMVGLPLLEVRQHALVRLEHRMRHSAKRPPVLGIILPQNADPIFAKVKILLAGVLHQTEVFSIRETNFFDAGPSAHWIALSAEQREAACQAALDSESLRLVGYEKGIRVIDAHKPYAVTIKFEGEASVGVKRKAALELEKILRTSCDHRLEVFCLEMKDASQLRRL